MYMCLCDSSHQFLHWKITYYRLKSGRVPNVDVDMHHLVKQNGMAAKSESLVYLTK